jgi:phosphatidylserine/phosphatidylglycerophosphate/cardiolipin synthase-like enzyme
MLRRSALPFAVVSLATVLLAGAGCKVQVPSAAASSGTSGAVAARTSGVTRVGSLIVEPGAGFSPVYDLIDRARHSIDVTMYEFSDTTAQRDLAAAARRGVRVHVILDQREKSVNSAAYSYLSSHAVKVTWSSPKYRYTHQKTVIIDGAEAAIMTANLTSRYYGTAHPKIFIGSENFFNTSLNDNRELGLIVSSHAVMSAIASTFATDFRNGQRWSSESIQR